MGGGRDGKTKARCPAAALRAGPRYRRTKERCRRRHGRRVGERCGRRLVVFWERRHLCAIGRLFKRAVRERNRRGIETARVMQRRDKQGRVGKRLAEGEEGVVVRFEVVQHAARSPPAYPSGVGSCYQPTTHRLMLWPINSGSALEREDGYSTTACGSLLKRWLYVVEFRVRSDGASSGGAEMREQG